MKTRLLVSFVSAVCTVACGPLEYTLDNSVGIPPIRGSSEVALSSFNCGDTIPAGKLTVATRAVAEGCELSFGEEVEVLKASDYDSIPALKTNGLPGGGVKLIQRVEILVNKLLFTDVDAAQALDLNTRVSAASIVINGQTLADKASLVSLPAKVSLSGEALDVFKTNFDKRAPIKVGVRVLVVLPPSPQPPANLKVDYDAQPAVVVGPGKLF